MMFYKSICILGIILICNASVSFAQHLYKEKDYQAVWCKNAVGVVEYVLDDKTRMDCLTEEYTIEFDFAPKWAEAVGQSLYYALKTSKKSGIVLIIERQGDEKHIEKLNGISEKYSIKAWIMRPEDIK